MYGKSIDNIVYIRNNENNNGQNSTIYVHESILNDINYYDDVDDENYIIVDYYFRKFLKSKFDYIGYYMENSNTHKSQQNFIENGFYKEL